MFKNATSFDGNVSTWDTSKVKDMSQMFYRASSFNQDISKWDVAKVSSMTVR